MKHPLRIGLAFDYKLAYPRGVLRGIKQFARNRPHWVLLPTDIEGPTVQALRAARPAGLIALVVSSALAAGLRSLRRPLVNVASVLPELPFPRVGVDHRLVGQLAATHLRERGFRYFAFVGHPRHLYSIEREAGFREALASQGGSIASYHEHPAKSYRQRGRLTVLDTGLQRWLGALNKPVGLFACHDVWGLQVVETCRLTGLRVPEDVAVIGVDNDDLLCELARPSLSSIMVPAERIGFEAAAMLERLMSGAKIPRRPRLIAPSGVVTRQSSDVWAGSDADVAAAARFIRDHAHTPISVEDVLREVSVSRRSLERRFRALLGRGLGEEIRRTHLERAKQMLTTTAMSMSEVAEQAGFSSVQYFSRIFGRATGHTPTAYRRRTQNPSTGEH